MEAIPEDKLVKMYHASRGVSYLKAKGIDASALVPETIHLNQDGSGVQMLLGGDGRGVLNNQNNMRRLRGMLAKGIGKPSKRGAHGHRNRMQGGKLKDSLLPSLIGVSPLIVRGLLNVAKHGTKNIKEDLGNVGKKFGDLLLDDAIRRGTKGLLTPKKTSQGTQTEREGIDYRTI